MTLKRSRWAEAASSKSHKHKKKKNSKTTQPPFLLPPDFEEKYLLKADSRYLKPSVSIDQFERLNHVDEGTYGVVERAKERKTGRIVALKQVKAQQDGTGFPVTALREIMCLQQLSHVNIVKLNQVVTEESTSVVFLALEFVGNDLSTILDRMEDGFSQLEVKTLMLQLLSGLHYMHSQRVMHRDIKPGNLLVSETGVLKIADFGMARPNFNDPRANLTRIVVSLWYRPPEVLLSSEYYNEKVDIWSAGCIFAELMTGMPLFKGKNTLSQLDKVFQYLGAPDDHTTAIYRAMDEFSHVNWRKYSAKSVQEIQESGDFPQLSYNGHLLLIEELLCLNPMKRVSALDALSHDYFYEPPEPKEAINLPVLSPKDG